MRELPPKKLGCFGRIMLWSLYLFGGSLVLSIIVSSILPNTLETSTPTIAPLPQVQTSVVGTDVFVGDVRWKVLSAENLGDRFTDDNMFTDDVTTTGTFIKVHFEIENLSKDMLTYAGLDLIDNQERKYISSSDVFGYIEDKEICIFKNLNPNIVKTCTSIYEVPKDAAQLKANPGDLEMFGSDEAFIDLGF